ncbi:hypothetical protein GCM10010156_65850 [Planobispora rosea]|uniref:Uncharacterized protein n=1 Tax=Planobispora rosea TaxID=35762 RepID=A0A8J3S8D0_PLARO|nr:hypothetical protein [Planobispora rosea]GGS98492.1 hypothetical protein GCM10010156_65850 [Planobispora rosea]GIH87876.1 hypothetical protein Pro02_62840 [Planobispora rosea]
MGLFDGFGVRPAGPVAYSSDKVRHSGSDNSFFGHLRFPPVDTGGSWPWSSTGAAAGLGDDPLPAAGTGTGSSSSARYSVERPTSA